jgi:tetratricopeptide (TPR) repeat protein
VGNLDKAEAARGQKDLPAAWNLTMEAIHERPYHPEAFLFLARIARSAGDMTLARQCAQRASRMAPQWKAVRKFLHNAESGKFLGKKARGFQPGRDLERFDLNKEQHRLSVCLVTYNDEKVIGQCLESIQDLAHQIIVVDLGSTDWTASIAERFGAEIHVREWHDDFSDLRNAALEKATGDWILMLNADEQLSAENLKLLAKHLEDQEVMAWRLPVVDVGQEAAGGRFVPVLYRNAPGLFYVGRIHEQITTSLEMRRTEWGLDNRLGKAQLVCHGIDAESLPHYKKIISDLALLEQAVQELPSDPNLVMNYGLELIRTGDEEKGMERYWEAFHLMASQSPDTIMPEVRETLLNQLVARLLEQREYSAVVDLLQSGPAQSLGLSASLHFSLGMAHMEMRHFDETAQQMRECLAKRDQGALTPVNAEIKGAAPWHALAICHLQQTQTREAEKAFEKALKDDPQSRPVRYDYSSFLAENDQPLVALEILDELVTEDPEDVAAWVRGGQIVLSHPEHARHALEWTVRAVALFPDHPVILWHRAEALLLTQNTQASLEIWERVASPSNARQMAAKILCQLVESKPCATNPGFESAVSQEFLKWYRVLIKLDADQMIQEVNDHISELIKVLPSAGKLLGYALAEARRDAAV